MSVSLVDTYMIPYPILVVKPFLRNFLIFFRLSLGLASGVLCSLCVYHSSRYFTKCKSQCCTKCKDLQGGGFVQFAGGGAIAHNRQAVKSRLYFLYIAPGYNSGTKNYKKLQMVFSDQLSHQKFFSIQITINIFSIQITIKKIKHLFRCFIFRIFYFFFFS